MNELCVLRHISSKVGVQDWDADGVQVGSLCVGCMHQQVGVKVRVADGSQIRCRHTCDSLKLVSDYMSELEQNPNHRSCAHPHAACSVR